MKKVTVPVRVSPQNKEKLKDIAYAEKTSVSELVNEMIEAFCDEVGINKEKTNA